jgi:hypothetical protein
MTTVALFDLRSQALQHLIALNKMHIFNTLKLKLLVVRLLINHFIYLNVVILIIMTIIKS